MSEDYSTNYGFLKRIISAYDVVSDAFRWHTRQNEGVTGTYSVILLDVQTSTGGSCMCSQAQQETTMTQERLGNLTVLNSHKERTAKFAPHPHFKRGGQSPPDSKNCSTAPGLPKLSLICPTMLHLPSLSKLTRMAYLISRARALYIDTLPLLSTFTDLWITI